MGSMEKIVQTPAPPTTLQNIARYLLAFILIAPGIGHLSFVRKDFQAQVPDWVPMNKDAVVVSSGFVEIALGLSLLLFPSKRVTLGRILAVFFVVIFPGNISQYTHHRSAFGLDTDARRGVRLLFQPVLVALALYVAKQGVDHYYRGRKRTSS